ncbi:MAG: hypothetical protein ACLVJ6_18010 [Merdibacter sp.]
MEQMAATCTFCNRFLDVPTGLTAINALGGKPCVMYGLCGEVAARSVCRFSFGM